MAPIGGTIFRQKKTDMEKVSYEGKIRESKQYKTLLRHILGNPRQIMGDLWPEKVDVSYFTRRMYRKT